MELLAQASAGANTAEVILFWVFAVIGLGAGIAMVTMRNIVHSALMLVVNLLAIGALYLGLQSSFLTIIQVIVYAGAIMVLFLFVIMLLGMDRDHLLEQTGTRQRAFAVLGAAGVAAIILFTIAGTYTSAASRCGDQADGPVRRTSSVQSCVGMETALAASEQGSVGVIADRLFTRYTFPFEAAAVLLTVATIGAMVLGRRTDVAQEDDPAFAPTYGVSEPDTADDEDRIVGDTGDEFDDDAFAGDWPGDDGSGNDWSGDVDDAEDR
jgi:NADH-quinone oxidoreductase subunit J